MTWAKKTLPLVCILLISWVYSNAKPKPLSIDQNDVIIELPEVILTDSTIVKVVFTDQKNEVFQRGILPLNVNGELFEVQLDEDGKGSFKYLFEREQSFTISSGDFFFDQEIKPNGLPLWLSLIPPLLAILLALVFKEIYFSLFAGILSGAILLGVYQDGFLGLMGGLLDVLNKYILGALHDEDHLSVIIFTTLIGGIVALISKNGGTTGIVNRISKFAKNAVSGQFATWLLGVAIFFDDYANSLVVGNTMRPITDKLKISREKLSYIVDSTAAPISSIALVSTWIGAEVGYIKDGLKIINHSVADVSEGPYSIFMSSLSYSFYPIFALLFILVIIFMKRDFGPMLTAERKARNNEAEISNAISTNEEINALAPVNGIKIRSFNAVIPILIIVLGTIIGLLYTGWDASNWSNESLTFGKKMSNTIGDANSYLALMWSSFSALLVAIILTISQRIMNLEKTVVTVVKGFKTMLNAILILILAWALANVTKDIHTAGFLTGLIGDSLPFWTIPSITFILSAIVAFSTGSSWSTMAILYPLVLPLGFTIGSSLGTPIHELMDIFYIIVASVLAGSVLGDHCSPISDTTILSSLATDCNHIQHVKTQLPYALTVGGIALLFGIIPASLGLTSWITFPVGVLVMFIIVKFFGKKNEA